MLKAYPKIALLFIICSLLFSVSACSKEEGEPDEYDDWQPRNEAYFATLNDSLAASPGQWRRIKNYSLNPDTEGQATDYIYAKVLAQGEGTDSPVYTDTVRVVYQGRLIPSATYPEGRIFEGTVYGDFSVATSYTRVFGIPSLVDGFATAMQHMRRGDHLRIYIPHQLGYGGEEQTSSSGAMSIPAYSTLIFDVQLVDFSHAGEKVPTWRSRQNTDI